MVISMDLSHHPHNLRPVFPLGLFRPTTVDFGTYFYRQPATHLSWNGVWVLLELAPDYGGDHHHVRTLYAVGLLPAQAVADQ